MASATPVFLQGMGIFFLYPKIFKNFLQRQLLFCRIVPFNSLISLFHKSKPGLGERDFEFTAYEVSGKTQQTFFRKDFQFILDFGVIIPFDLAAVDSEFFTGGLTGQAIEIFHNIHTDFPGINYKNYNIICFFVVESKKQILQTEKFFIQIHNAERAEKEKTMWGVKEKTEWRNGVYLTTCESSLQADILEIGRAHV